MPDFLVNGELTRTFEMWVSADTIEEAHANALREHYISETEGSVLKRTVTAIRERRAGRFDSERKA